VKTPQQKIVIKVTSTGISAKLYFKSWIPAWIIEEKTDKKDVVLSWKEMFHVPDKMIFGIDLLK
jgi:hypothetical protein